MCDDMEVRPVNESQEQPYKSGTVHASIAFHMANYNPIFTL